jgi:hypothetical protein
MERSQLEKWLFMVDFDNPVELVHFIAWNWKNNPFVNFGFDEI